CRRYHRRPGTRTGVMRAADVFDALMTGEPAAKCAAARTLHARDASALAAPREAPQLVPVPGRPAQPELVHPAQLKKRGLGTPAGRAALIHAIAHIEFNAINLGLDAAYRFRDMPVAFYTDWLRVAADESRHFELLNNRLADYGHSYGDFEDRKSTRLNSSHVSISYAVFCLKKKNKLDYEH